MINFAVAVNSLLAVPRFFSKFGSFLTSCFHQSAEVECVFDRRRGEEIDRRDHEDARVVGALEAGEQEYRGAPEEAPEAECDNALNPASESVPQKFHGPDPQGSHEISAGRFRKLG